MARKKTRKTYASHSNLDYNFFSILMAFALIIFASLSLVSLQIYAYANGDTPVCTPTGFYRDGINLTAAVFNPLPGTITQDVNAAGCDIGIYMNHGTWLVTDSKVHNARYFGILVDGNSNPVTVNINNTDVYQIGDLPFDGSQHGVGIYYSGNALGQVSGNTVYNYQKGGIVVDGNGTNVTVTGNTVNGLGQVNFIAQNGIQFSRGASGDVRDNKIQNNFYTGTVGVGPNPGGQNPPGWQYTSTGLLLYQAGNVKNAQNFFSGNQKNVAVIP